jgi:RNA polymerase sigma-70 factor (ECF subfamily)
MLRTMDDRREDGLLEDAMTPFDVRAAFVEHGRALFGFAYNSTRDTAIAEDCVQETFVRAWRARGKYTSARASERTWLFAIARNVVIDQMRERARRPTPVEDESIERRPTPVAESDAVDDRVTLYSGLAQLSEEHRAVIVAVQLDGMTYQQLEAMTGVPAATLRTRMFYGLRALRTVLGEGER